MAIYYLYIKTHTQTGLKYLGFTRRKDPHSYNGSGTEWLQHLKEFGEYWDTQILLKTESRQEASDTGRFFSKLWGVVNSPEWANKIPETLGGPGWDSQFAIERNNRRVREGTHHWLGGEFQTELNKKRIADGTHNWLDGTAAKEHQLKRIAAGTHHFLQDEYIEKMRRVTREHNQRRLEEGTHHLKNNVFVYDIDGNMLTVSKEEFQQFGGKLPSSKYAHTNSKEGKRRKGLQHI